MFGIVEKDVPPDIGRVLGGVSLLFSHLGLHGPPTTLTPGPLPSDFCRIVEEFMDQVRRSAVFQIIPL